VHNFERKNGENRPSPCDTAFTLNGCFVMFVWCETVPRCLSIDGWSGIRTPDLRQGRMKMQVRKNQVRLCRDGKCKYGKSKYKCAKTESVSTEKWSTIELGWKMHAQTDGAGKVKHNNSPIILKSDKQLSPVSVNLW